MRMHDYIKPLIILIIIGVVIGGLYDLYDTASRGCKPNGEQRFVNSMVHAGDGAISTLVIEDKLVCKDGSFKWRAQYQ